MEYRDISQQGDNKSSAREKPGLIRHLQNNRVNTLILAIVTGLVFLNSLYGQFILDDIDIIFNSEIVKNFDLIKIFTLNYWHDTTADNLYRPLTVLTYAIDWKISGGDPFYFHAVNVTIHLMATLALYHALAAIGVSPLASLGASALFAVHPIHGEDINIITGRAELLSALFVLTGLCLHITRKKAAAWAVPLLYAAALLSKESGIVLLPIILVTDLHQNRLTHSSLWEKRYFYATMLLVAVLWAAINYGYIQRENIPIETKYNPSDNPLAFYGNLPRLIGAMEIQLKYLQLLLLPTGLHLVYGASDLTQTGDLAPVHALTITGLVLAILIAAVYLWKKKAIAAWAVACMAITVLPTSNLIITLEPLMAERFMYLPSAFFAAIIVPGILTQLKKETWKKIAATIIAVYIITLSGLTVKANPTYKTPAVLWDTVFETAKKNGRIWYYRASEHLLKGDLETYEKIAREGIKTDPAFPDAYYQLSIELLRQGRYKEAHEILKGIVGKPYAAAITKAVDGICIHKMGDAKGAEHLFREIENDRTEKGGKHYCYLCGLTKADKGDMDGALICFERAATIISDPKDLRAVTIEYIKRGDGKSAQKWAEMLLETKSDGPSNNLMGIAYAYQNKNEEAVTYFRKAVTLSPGIEEYRANYRRAQSLINKGTGKY